MSDKGQIRKEIFGGWPTNALPAGSKLPFCNTPLVASPLAPPPTPAAAQITVSPTFKLIDLSTTSKSWENTV